MSTPNAAGDRQGEYEAWRARREEEDAAIARHRSRADRTAHSLRAFLDLIDLENTLKAETERHNGKSQRPPQ